MQPDDIIAEVWRNRDAFVKRHHHDLDRIVRDLRRREKRHPAAVVDRRARPVTKQR